MTSTTSPVKKKNVLSFMKWSIRRNLAVTVVYSLLLLVIFPIISLWYITMSNNNFRVPLDELREGIAEMSLNFYPATSAVVSIFAIILAMFMFSFLHNKRSVDMYASLPLKRSEIFRARYFAGLCILTIPLIITGLISMLTTIQGGTEVTWYITVNMLYTLLGGIALYTFSCFMAICCGKIIDAIILIITITGAFPIAVFMSESIFVSCIPGLGNVGLLPTLLYSLLSPESVDFLAVFAYKFSRGMTTELVVFTIWWLVFIGLSLFGCIRIMNKRKMECAQTGFAFKMPAYLIRFIVSYTSGLLLAMIISSVSSLISEATIETDMNVFVTVWFWIGVIIGSFICHMILQLIFSKGFKGFVKSLWYYGAVVLVTAVLYCLTITGFCGIDTYIPDVNDVKSISINTNLSNEFFDDAILNDSDSISGAMKIHSSIVDTMREKTGYPYAVGLYRDFYVDDIESTNGFDFSDFEINYELKNGKTFKRTYKRQLIKDEKIQQMIFDLYSSEEYIIKSHKVFTNDPKYLYSVDVTAIKNSNIGSSYESVSEITDAQKKALIEALREECVATDNNVNHLINGWKIDDIKEGYQVSLSFLDEEMVFSDGFTVNITTDYTKTIDVLKSIMKLPKYSEYESKD